MENERHTCIAAAAAAADAVPVAAALVVAINYGRRFRHKKSTAGCREEGDREETLARHEKKNNVDNTEDGDIRRVKRAAGGSCYCDCCRVGGGGCGWGLRRIVENFILYYSY